MFCLAKLFLRNALLPNHYDEWGEVMDHAAQFPQHRFMSKDMTECKRG